MIVRVEKEYKGEDFRQILPFTYKKLAEKVAAKVLETEGCPFEAEVSLLLTDDAEIREMNRDLREIDRVTDVLSFPMADYNSPADFSTFEEGDPDLFDPETGLFMLGDIVIDVRQLKRQAEEYGHSTRREYAFLIAHSMLHLVGYDHMTEEEARDMESRQEAVLQSLGISRN